MNKKIYLFFSLILILILATGCNSDKKALEKGKEALANEQLEEAKEFFNKAVEKGDNEDAKEYLQVIETAEELVTRTEEEDFDQAIEQLDELKEHKLFNEVHFIIRDSEKVLEEVINQREEINKQISLLEERLEVNGENFVPDDAFFESIDDLLSEKFISKDQIDQLTKLHEIAEQKQDQQPNNNQGNNEKPEQPNQPGENTEPEKPNNQEGNNGSQDQEQPGNINDNEDENGDSEHTDDGNQPDEEDFLSIEEAQTLVEQFLATEYSQDYLNSDDVNLNYDHDENGNYIFQFYQVADGRTQTLGWYGVNPVTKEVYDAFN